MEIANSALRLESRHYQESRSLNVTFSRMQVEIVPPAETPATTTEASQRPLEESQLSEEGMRLSARDALKLSIMKAILERLAGHRFQVFEGESLNPQTPNQESPLTASRPVLDQPLLPEIRWSVELKEIEWRREREHSEFQAIGIVQTRDGREISFIVHLDMARDFESLSVNSLTTRGGPLEDPLVINFDAAAAQLGPDPIEFDLTIDGQLEGMPFLQPGSGFLVHDPDGKGQITSGAQLFGPETGQGFQELARHDDDGNGWIDAGDSIYQDLAIWHRDAAGNFHVSDLSEMGIGAISLDRTDTPFTLTDPQGNTLGQTRKTGLYLGLNGEIGTVQQLDLRV
ncbi:hypothetical protein VCB98_02410 [Gammaproteobacteria bacterium AB-CW1]|uniref:VCBS repeat-containing protein n=1 Tax=Natronospira elongata TaxID=3110268 RepID=A0AAP6JDX4_9GAMM|nr:hypothetical protein [Gammaproteobacteria bacterium AB-CW1]